MPVPGRPGNSARTIAAGALAAALAAGFAFELWRHQGAGGDFWTFWAAARVLASGGDPYVYSALLHAGPKPAGPPPGPFLSPLFMAMAFRPLAALPFRTAAEVWLACNLALSCALVLVLAHLAGARRGVWPLVWTSTLLVAFQPFDITLWLGQTDVLVVTALAASCWAMDRDRPWLAGLLTAVAAADIHLLPGFGLYLLYRALGRRDVRPLAGLALGLALEAGLCLLHPGDAGRWLLVTLPHAQKAALEPWDTLSVLQAAGEFWGTHWAPVVAGGLDLAVIAAAIGIWRRRTAAPADDFTVAAVVTLACTTFAYNQDYLLLALALPFFTREVRHAGAQAWRTAALAMSLAVGAGLAELTGGPVAPSHAVFVLGAPLVAAALTGLRLPAAALRPYGWWAGGWAAFTLAAYAVLTVTRSEVGPEVLMLSGLLCFMALRALSATRLTDSARPAPHRGLAPV